MVDGPSRRAVLGSAGALGAGMALGGGAEAAWADGPSGARPSPQAARAAVRRLLPRHADQITLRTLDGPERFEVDGSRGAVRVSGTSPAVALTGLHWYLKYDCDAHVSWAGSQLDLPDTLPAPHAGPSRRATVPQRFALNDTHDGYTAPYADWARWERLIDVLALHGVNQVLVTPGAEAVYHRLFQEFGYTDAELRAWIPAPSHQPWWLLQNMSSYGGPVSPELLRTRTELGQRIVRRLRELGMAPVLPGYFGTVPDRFADRNPGGRTIPQGTWSGLKRPDWLDPRTSVFRSVAAAYYRHQQELFGTVRHVKMDLLHEGGDPGDVPVADAARAVETALQTARPGATWVILGWQSNPRPELLRGLAHKDRMLIVDGLSDLQRITDREQDFAGVPYAFGSIPNFGGRTTIGARAHVWTQRFTVWRDRAGSTLAGTAYMPEAAERDPAAFELFSELAWREEPVDREQWFARYARFRYGGTDASAREALAALRETAYHISSADGRPHDSIFAARPDLAARSGTRYATHTPAFDLADFDAAFAGLLRMRAPLRGSEAYRHDLIDAARQSVADRSWMLIGQLQAAYDRADRKAFGALAALWLKLVRLADDVAGGQRGFLLGPWLADARRAGADAQESDRLEHTARALITTWADRATADGGHLADYANRNWQGLAGEFHLPRWQTYLDDLEDALATGRAPADFDWYAREEPWTRAHGDYPQRPTGDAHALAQRAHDVLAKAPYQGEVTVTAKPQALAPGAACTLTASFRNLNGLRATGTVDFTLSGLEGAAPQGATRLPRVAAAGRGSARWRFTAPGGTPKAPLVPLPYTLAVDFGPHGEGRVRSSQHGSLFVAGPLADGLRTVATNDAVFGQLGDAFAMHGGGADMWRGTAEFGAVYRPGGLREGAAVTVRVVAQPRTGPWARAGLVVRNALATAGETGFADLAVTPDNGVVLSWDADGDGLLDTYRRITGLRAPVLLRLTRGTGGALTAACSSDDGATWRTVAAVSLSGAASRLDAGLFMSAANGGSGAQATVEFADWHTT